MPRRKYQRPSLHQIYRDRELLTALTHFTTKQYMSGTPRSAIRWSIYSMHWIPWYLRCARCVVPIALCSELLNFLSLRVIWNLQISGRTASKWKRQNVVYLTMNQMMTLSLFYSTELKRQNDLKLFYFVLLHLTMNLFLLKICQCPYQSACQSVNCLIFSTLLLMTWCTPWKYTENILFLQAANSLIAKIDAFIVASEFQDVDTSEVDMEIVSIYDKFIRNDSKNQQINVSYSCGSAMDRLFEYENYQNSVRYGWSLQQKQRIFDQCILEIERLMVCIQMAKLQVIWVVICIVLTASTRSGYVHRLWRRLWVHTPFPPLHVSSRLTWNPLWFNTVLLWVCGSYLNQKRETALNLKVLWIPCCLRLCVFVHSVLATRWPLVYHSSFSIVPFCQIWWTPFCFILFHSVCAEGAQCAHSLITSLSHISRYELIPFIPFAIWQQTSVLTQFYTSDEYLSIMDRRTNVHRDRPTLMKAKSLSAADRRSYTVRVDHHRQSRGSHGPHGPHSIQTQNIAVNVINGLRHSPSGPSKKGGNGSPQPRSPRIRKKPAKIVSLKPPLISGVNGIDQQSSPRFVKSVLNSIDFDAVRPILPQFEQYEALGVSEEDDDDDLVDVNDSLFDDTPPSNHLQLSYTPKLSLKQSETPLAWMEDDDVHGDDTKMNCNHSNALNVGPPQPMTLCNVHSDPTMSIHPICSDHEDDDGLQPQHSVHSLRAHSHPRQSAAGQGHHHSNIGPDLRPDSDPINLTGFQYENLRIAAYLKQRKMPKQLAHVHFDKVTESMTVSSAGTPRPRVCLLDSHGLRSGLHEWEIEVLQTDVMLQEVGVVGTPHIEHVRIQKHGIIATRNLGPRAVFGNELRARSLYYSSINQDDTKRCHRDLKMLMGWREHDIIRIMLDLNKWRIKLSVTVVVTQSAIHCVCPWRRHHDVPFDRESDDDESERDELLPCCPCTRRLAVSSPISSMTEIATTFPLPLQCSCTHSLRRYYINGQKVGKPMSLQRGAMYFPVIAFTGNCRYRLRSTWSHSVFGDSHKTLSVITATKRARTRNVIQNTQCLSAYGKRTFAHSIIDHHCFYANF